LIILLILSCGFVSAKIRAISVQAPVLTKEMGVKKIQGVIENVETRTHGKRFILTDLKIEGIEQSQTPTKIRVNINVENDNEKSGDVVSFLASLSPPPKAIIPDGYDFSRYAYFKQIGAVGYAVSDINIINSPEAQTIAQKITTLRQAIIKRILSHADNTNSQVAIALLVGEQGGIDKQTMEDVRVAGVAHILAVSGLNLSIVASLFFFCSRFIFASIGNLALNYNIKKWAAYIAIVGSFAYLLISGSQISAERAFIMTTLILVAVILDRNGSPMRSVAIAALLILALTPESILSPSFQMSFAAVFALISIYELCRKLFINSSEYGVIRKIIFYLFGVVFSSLVAGIATAPFSMHHFYNIAPYGLITNLLAVPITSLFVMPAGVVALLLMPLGLENLGLKPMLFGIDTIIKFSKYIASLPQPVGLVGRMSDSTFCLLTAGGIIFIILKTKLRYAGLPFIILGIFVSFNREIPNIIIGEEAKLFAIKTTDEKLAFSSKVKERYSREEWQKRFAIAEDTLITQIDKNTINCDSLRCVYKYGDKITSIIKHPMALENDCKLANLIINLTNINQPCNKPELVISKQDLRENGTTTITFINNKIIINSVRKLNPNRLWQGG
jgi:competence protein ComEC